MVSGYYYGIIYYDNPNGGGSHQRLWESPIYDDSTSASASVFDEIMTGRYDGIVGISWTITGTGE